MDAKSTSPGEKGFVAADLKLVTFLLIWGKLANFLLILKVVIANQSGDVRKRNHHNLLSLMQTSFV